MISAETSTRIAKIYFALKSKQLRRALSKGVGAAIEHQILRELIQPDVVLDVGANRGQFALIARDNWPKSQIFSFEPLSKPCQTCRQVMASDRRFRLVQAGIAEHAAQLAINVANNDDSSSFLMPTTTQFDLYKTTITTTEQVVVGPLLDFLSTDDLSGFVLLKIDTQGFELEVLRGAEACLSAISAVYAEVSFVELYEGQPLANDIIGWLADRGFALAGVFGQTYSPTKTAVQADMLFIKTAR